jgi:LmbE family N-acetylglucosaminyl deacetylase
MKNTVLVVAAHPDDEILGCGGTMAKHSLAGDEVHVLILAEGLTSREQKRDRSKSKEALTKLSKSSQRANEIVGVKTLVLHDFPDNRMDGIDLIDVVKVVEDCLKKIKPNTIYTHNHTDLNVDHRIAHEAVVTACRPGSFPSVHTLLFFEVPSSTEWQTPGHSPAFSPNWFVDISTTFKKKLAALEAYADEMRPWPHPRSIKAVEHLARWRGATVAAEAAEAFVLGRKNQ